MMKNLFVFVLLSLLIPTCCADNYFYDSDAFVVGKCRTIYHNGSWSGYYRGYNDFFAISSSQDEGESVFISIHTNGSSVFKENTNYFSFTVRYATGIFVWNLRNIHVGDCPWIFIWCHAELIRVELYQGA